MKLHLTIKRPRNVMFLGRFIVLFVIENDRKLEHVLFLPQNKFCITRYFSVVKWLNLEYYIFDLTLSQNKKGGNKTVSPRTKQQNQELREQRIQEIVTATIYVYAKKGFLGTQMEEVAKEAGMAKGLLYYYFKTKGELFRYVFEQMMGGAVGAAQDLTEGKMSLRESLTDYIKFFIHAVYVRPHMTMAYYRLNEDFPKVFKEKELDCLEVFQGFNQPLVDAFRIAMEKGEIQSGSPEIAASVFWNGLAGTTMTILKLPEALPEEEVIQQLSYQLLDGLFNNKIHD
ncbi:TetR/AcrR family transcriptional regulator [Microbacteriaceae bacterium 4G12]